MSRTTVSAGFTLVIVGFAFPAIAQPPESLYERAHQQIAQEQQQMRRRPYTPSYQVPYNGPQFAQARQRPQRQSAYNVSAQGCVTRGPGQACFGTNGYSESVGNSFNVGAGRDANGQTDYNIGFSYTAPSVVAPTVSASYSPRTSNVQVCAGVDVGAPNPIMPTQRIVSASGQVCVDFPVGSTAPRSNPGSSNGTVYFDDNAPSNQRPVNVAPRNDAPVPAPTSTPAIQSRRAGESAGTAAVNFGF